jgi:hypothetical protein
MPVAARAMGLSETDLRRRLVRAMETLMASLRPLLETPEDATMPVPTQPAAEGPETP